MSKYDFKKLLVESGIIPREAARLYERWGALEPGTADGSGEIIFERPTKEEMEEAFVEFDNELYSQLKFRPTPRDGATNVNPDNKPPSVEVPQEDFIPRVEILEEFSAALEEHNPHSIVAKEYQEATDKRLVEHLNDCITKVSE